MAHDRQHSLYIRNQILAPVLFLVCVQILDFLAIHRLFGPWTVTLRALMVDLERLLVVVAVFVMGFTLHMTAIYQPLRPRPPPPGPEHGLGYPPREFPVQTALLPTMEMMFFAMFGLVDSYNFLPPLSTHPAWASVLVKLVLAVYMVVTGIVLVGLLVAMMCGTLQRLGSESDTEWKFGAAQLIRRLSQSSSPPAPLNLVTKLFVSLHALVRFRAAARPRRLEDAVDWRKVADKYLAGQGRGASGRRASGLLDGDDTDPPPEPAPRTL
ncbi:short transient receptor potential channel 5-like [Pollicipes pollicipes]|uniref:short transient receptor potential channel 5-like n=1 Tax=Pollicipes pollicipes TaxID=41117 RepID=UPI00188530A2|nr:short transient receptor potential channel 5-like [Pollicipes pollicipes]